MTIPFYTRNNEKPYNINKIEVRGLKYLKSLNFKLIYVLNGSINYQMNSQNYKINEFEGLIINKGQNEIIWGEEATILILDISSDFIEDYKSIYNDSIYLNYIPINMLDRNIVLGLNKLYQARDSNYIHQDSYVKDILNLIFDFYRDKNAKISSYDKKLEIMDEISKQATIESIKDLSLSKLSKKLFTTEQNISHIFKEVKGINFSEYIQQVKLYYAILYLLNTSNTIDDIAQDLGFTSARSINRIFNKYLEQTPSEYRAKNIKKSMDLSDFENYKTIEVDRDILRDYIKDKSYELDTSKEASFISERIKNNFGTIFNIGSLGEDFLKSIEEEIYLDIKHIILKIKKVDSIYYEIKGLNKLLTTNQLQDIIHMCYIRRIKITLGLYVEKEDIIENKSKLYNQYNEFYNLVLGIIGKTGMKNLNYIIYIGDILDYSNTDYRFNEYKDYIILQQRLLRDITGTRDFHWGFDLGDLTYESIEVYKETYRKLYKENNKYKPEYIFVNFDNKYTLNINEVKTMKEISKLGLERLEMIYKNMDEISYPGKELYITGLFEYIDISSIPLKHRDIFISGFILSNILAIEGINSSFNYNIEYKFKDEKIVDGKYSPDFINEYGIKLSYYWLVYIINDIYGHLIYKEDGTIFLKDRDNIYILIFGDMLLDYNQYNGEEIDELYNYKKNINIELLGLEGKYKVSSFEMSLRHGNLLYNIDSYDDYNILNYKEKELLRGSSYPRVRTKIEYIDDGYVEKISKYPFHIIIKRYTLI